MQGGIPNNGLPAGLNNLSTLNTSLSGGVGNQGPANPWNAALGQANRLGNPGLGNPGLGNQPLGGALSNSSLQGSGGLQGFPSSQGLQGKPGTPVRSCEPVSGWLLLLSVANHDQPRCFPCSSGSAGLRSVAVVTGMQGLPGSAGSLQGLQYSQGLQGLLQASQGLQGLPSNSSLQGMRLNMSNTPQPIGPPTAGQAPRSDQLTSASSYSLFKAPSNSSLHAAPSANGKVAPGRPFLSAISDYKDRGTQPIMSPRSAPASCVVFHCHCHQICHTPAEGLSVPRLSRVRHVTCGCWLCRAWTGRQASRACQRTCGATSRGPNRCPAPLPPAATRATRACTATRPAGTP